MSGWTFLAPPFVQSLGRPCQHNNVAAARLWVTCMWARHVRPPRRSPSIFETSKWGTRRRLAPGLESSAYRAYSTGPAQDSIEDLLSDRLATRLLPAGTLRHYLPCERNLLATPLLEHRWVPIRSSCIEDAFQR